MRDPDEQRLECELGLELELLELAPGAPYGLGGALGADEALPRCVLAQLGELVQVDRRLVRAHREVPYRTLLLAWGAVRDREKLARDEEGRYFLPPEGGER